MTRADDGSRTTESDSEDSSTLAAGSEPTPTVPREFLVGHREELRVELDEAMQALTAIRTLRANGFDDDEHDPDGDPLSAEWSRLEGRRRAAAATLAAADAAIARFDAGRYGTCAGCGRSIPLARLEALPNATHCVRCADAGFGYRRPGS